MNKRRISKYFEWSYFILNIWLCIMCGINMLGDVNAYLLEFVIYIITVVALYLSMFKHNILGLYIVTAILSFNIVHSFVLKGTAVFPDALIGLIGLGLLWIPKILPDEEDDK